MTVPKTSSPLDRQYETVDVFVPDVVQLRARMRASLDALDEAARVYQADRSTHTGEKIAAIVDIRRELAVLFIDNAPTILAALETMHKKDEALKLTERTLAFIPDEAIPKDMHAAVGLLKRKITAALADTTPNEGG